VRPRANDRSRRATACDNSAELTEIAGEPVELEVAVDVP
jgi:hypothetical protein